MTKIQFIFAILGTLLSYGKAYGALESTGQTANGCNYSVINGKYLYDCSNTTKPSASPPSPSKATPVVESYSSIPVMHNSTASPVTNPAALEKTLEPKKLSSNSSSASLDAARGAEESSPFTSQSYFGFLAGSTGLNASGAGKSTGLGLTLGSNLDDYVGLELNYSYTTQDLNLDLANRSTIPGSNVPGTDSSLNAHLLSAEVQLHATDLSSRARPYVSAGIGWKRSSLEDLGQGGFAGNAAIAGSKVSQSSFGSTAAVGTKIRVSESFQGVIDFRYFLPIINGAATVAPGRLTEADSPLTKSSLYQFQLGVLYHF